MDRVQNKLPKDIMPCNYKGCTQEKILRYSYIILLN